MSSLSLSSLTCGPPGGAPQPRGLETMDVMTLSRMSAADRNSWYQRMLLAYRAQISRSAACHGIPSQLLATVILNELADINWTDVWQQRLGMNGSLGIGQIQVTTAERNRLVEFPGDRRRLQQDALTANRLCSLMSTPGMGGGMCPTPAEYERMLSREMVRRRLTIPEYAIEAAAREIRRILDEACVNQRRPWVARFGFTLTTMASLTSPADLYNHIAGSSALEREQNLSEMVVAAYNSPQILIAQQQASVTWGSPQQIYRNGMIHGANSRSIAADLHRSRTFH